MVHTWNLEDNSQELALSSSIMWVLGIELRSWGFELRSSDLLVGGP